MANYITISRILLIFPVLYLITPETSSNNWLALSLFVIAGLTDHLDGYIARKTGTTTSVGALLDLMADKLLVIICLVYLLSFHNTILLLIPSLVIIAREIIISSLRQYLSQRDGKNVIKVSFVAKSKTTLQITALSFLIISPNFGDSFFALTLLLFWLAAYVSVQSLYGYFKSYLNLIK